MRTVESLSEVAAPAFQTTILNALANPLRIEILRRHTSSRSPKDVADATGESLSNVSYHTRILARSELLKLDHTKQRRGAIAHFYVVPPNAKKAIEKVGTDVAKLANRL